MAHVPKLHQNHRPNNHNALMRHHIDDQIFALGHIGKRCRQTCRWQSLCQMRQCSAPSHLSYIRKQNRQRPQPHSSRPSYGQQTGHPPRLAQITCRQPRQIAQSYRLGYFAHWLSHHHFLALWLQLCRHWGLCQRRHYMYLHGSYSYQQCKMRHSFGQQSQWFWFLWYFRPNDNDHYGLDTAI